MNYTSFHLDRPDRRKNRLTPPENPHTPTHLRSYEDFPFARLHKSSKTHFIIMCECVPFHTGDRKKAENLSKSIVKLYYKRINWVKFTFIPSFAHEVADILFYLN